MTTGVSLTVSDEERELMQEILEEHRRRFLGELARADHHEYKVILRKKESIVESLLGRLTTAA